VRQQLVDWIMAHALRHSCDEEVRAAPRRAGARNSHFSRAARAPTLHHESRTPVDLRAPPLPHFFIFLISSRAPRRRRRCTWRCATWTSSSRAAVRGQRPQVEVEGR
jgi:hypothetical protein